MLRGRATCPCSLRRAQGTQDLPVSYELCDGFVVVCPQTPTSVRFSQAMAYASTWMGALAGAYAFLSNRAMQKAAPAKEEEAGRGEEEAAPPRRSDRGKTTRER